MKIITASNPATLSSIPALKSRSECERNTNCALMQRCMGGRGAGRVKLPTYSFIHKEKGFQTHLDYDS